MVFSENRYANMQYRRCGKSGLLLPAVSLGLWHNFGDVDDADIYRKTLHTAFDNESLILTLPIITDHRPAALK